MLGCEARSVVIFDVGSGSGDSARRGTNRAPFRPRMISDSASGCISSRARASVTSSFARSAGKSTSLTATLPASFIIVRPQPHNIASADHSQSVRASPFEAGGKRVVIAPDVAIQQVNEVFASSHACEIARAVRQRPSWWASSTVAGKFFSVSFRPARWSIPSTCPVSRRICKIVSRNDTASTPVVHVTACPASRRRADTFAATRAEWPTASATMSHDWFSCESTDGIGWRSAPPLAPASNKYGPHFMSDEKSISEGVPNARLESCCNQNRDDCCVETTLPSAVWRHHSAFSP